MVSIRHAKIGDEECLAYIQTESWKDAFRDIVPAELLSECTKIERANGMYKKLLRESKGNGYILELDGKPYCIAWWDASGEKDMPDVAELRCIHSLKENRRKGYGGMILEQVMYDAKSVGYSKMMLWVFENNVRAISFYKAHGFTATGKKQPAFGAIEEMYIREL